MLLKPLTTIGVSRTLKLMMPVSDDVWTQLFRTGGMVTPGSWVITNSRQARQRLNRMQAMGKRPNGGQQTYNFATMYTQLKLFADPTPDPSSETESEDEVPLWELRNRRRRRNDEGPQHEGRDVLYSKMKAYTDLVFEHAKHNVSPRGSLKCKAGDGQQRRGNVLLLISWTQIAKSVSPERES